VLKIASLINADQTGVFFGQHAILVFSVVLAGMFAAGIGLWYLLDQPGSRVWHFAPEDRQRFQDSAISYAFRDRFFRPFARVAYRPSPKGHLCLYYTISLFVLAVTGASFLLLGLKIRQQDWLVRFDHSFSASLHEHSTVNAVWIFQWVSFFGDALTLAFISLLFVIALVVTRYWRLFFLWTITLPGAGILSQFLKNALQRQRPQLTNAWIAESGWSFPSGHAMCSLVIYGLLAYSICFLPTSRTFRLAFGLFTILLVIAIGFSRLYLGAHFFSDVMAGYFAAIFWLLLCIMGNRPLVCKPPPDCSQS
jgi:membrane-associated phospholipid phosphatase